MAKLLNCAKWMAKLALSHLANVTGSLSCNGRHTGARSRQNVKVTCHQARVTYRGHIVVGAAAFGQQSVPNFPCKYRRTFAFVVCNLGHHIRRGNSWFAATNCTRSDWARFVITAENFWNATVGHLQTKMKKQIELSVWVLRLGLRMTGPVCKHKIYL